VVASSTGNHAQALAFAARLRGIPAHVVVPRSIPSIKLEAIADYGARITFCDTATRLIATARLVARDTEGVLIASAEHPDVIAGQGTAALELLDEVPDLGVLVFPTGGGGLLAGSCLAARNGARAVAVFGAEPASADDTARSLAAGRMVPMTEPASSIADGLLVSLAEPSWAVIQNGAAGIVTVGEDEIRSALRLIWERMKLWIEPSAAVAVAAVLSTSLRTYRPSQPVGVLLTGGNTALHRQWMS
jgi:threonine dehydratase